MKEKDRMRVRGYLSTDGNKIYSIFLMLSRNAKCQRDDHKFRPSRKTMTLQILHTQKNLMTVIIRGKIRTPFSIEHLHIITTYTNRQVSLLNPR